MRVNRVPQCFSVTILAGLFLVGCSKNIQNTQAVREAVLADLEQRKSKTGIDPSAMEISLGNVSFGQDEARANVQFSLKSIPGSGGMGMTYVLKREGDKWIVTDRQPSIVAPQGAGDGLPSGKKE